MKRICPFTGLEVAVMDTEFFYDGDYTLSDMPIAVFMQDPRFELMISCIEVDVGEPVHFSGNVLDTREWIKQFELDKKVLVSHYAFIEGSILEWKLRTKPQRYWCTMMGARPFHVPWTGGASLELLAEHAGIGAKGNVAKKMKGRHWHDLDGGEQLEYVTYCRQDTSLSGLLYDGQVQKFKEWNPSGDEANLIDLTIKKFVRPRLMLDRGEIKLAYDDLVLKKAEILRASGVDKATLMSDEKLSDYLRSVMHVNVPMKYSTKKEKNVPAFAKTDAAFQGLRSQGKQVAAIVDARLAHKSTIEESRLARFAQVAAATQDILPVPLMYYGAHPGRFSGADKLNLQNLGRASRLRAAIVAPPGYALVTGDLSQIEARITATLAGQHDLVEDFRSGIDVYSKFATKIYGYPVNKKDHEKKERFVGKTGVLSLGFMAGAIKFQTTMNDVFHFPMTADEATTVVSTYRTTYQMIPQLWRKLDQLTATMCHLGTRNALGPLMFCYHHVVLPNGMPIFYRELQRSSAGWTYQFGPRKEMMFSGKLLENVVQAMARIIMTTAELKLAKLGYRAALSVHDELIYVIKLAQVEGFKRVLQRALSAPVRWMPSLPVACEVKSGRTYLEAK